MPFPKASARQPTYLFEMMQRLGIEPGEGVIPRLSMLHITAVHRCQACPAKEACRKWLDGMPRSVAMPPDFCPNDDILFELRVDQPGHAGVATDHHAHIADLERYVDEINEQLLRKGDDDPSVAGLKSHRAHLREVIQWLRRKPSDQACCH